MRRDPTMREDWLDDLIKAFADIIPLMPPGCVGCVTAAKPADRGVRYV